MLNWQHELKGEILYDGIALILSCTVLFICSLLICKIGVNAVLRGIRSILSFHWLIKFIVSQRNQHQYPHELVTKGIQDIINNDEEAVNEIVKGQTPTVDQKTSREK